MPFAAASQPTTAFSTSGPVVGSESSGFRSIPPPPLPLRYTDPSIPPPSSNAPPTAGPSQHFPTPQFTTNSQPQQSMSNAPPSQFSIPPPPVALRPSQIPSSAPMGSPPQSMNFPQFPLVDSSFSAPKTNLQPSSPPFESSYQTGRATLPPPTVPGYPSRQANAVTQAPAAAQFPPTFAHQGGSYGPAPPPSSQFIPPSSQFISHQAGYIQPPPLAAHVQGLVEDFNSLSLGSVPGSIEPGLDLKALPRPLDGDDGDVGPASFAETYPMNCNSRYLRLTTSAIPNSQSLVSRWHLPLGAVVCPLAEPPDGVSLSALKNDQSPDIL